MKIEVDVLGVEQAVDFNTLASASFVVLEVFGERVRVPISEEQLVTMTSAAMDKKVGSPSLAPNDEEVFEETRASGGQTFSPGLVSEEIPERDYSVMAGLTEQASEAESDNPLAGVLPSVFGDPEKEKQLRARRPRRVVAQDEAGNPVVQQHAATVAPLPKMSMYGLSDDDGFAQG